MQKINNRRRGLFAPERRLNNRAKKIWKFLVFILLSSSSVHAASGLKPRDSLFAVLDLDTSIVASEGKNKSMTRFRLDFGYDQTFSKFFGDKDLHLHASYSFRYGPSALGPIFL